MIKKILLAVLLILFVALLFVPTMLSTSSGNRFVASLINRSIAGTVAFDRASFGWLGPQSAENITLADRKGKSILTIEEVATDTSLFALAFSRKLGPTTIVDLDAQIEQLPNGKTNLQLALDRTQKVSDDIRGKSVPITVTDVNASFSEQILRVDGKTQLDEKKGEISVEWDTSKDLRFLTADIRNLPVALLDQFVAREHHGYMGLLSALIGPSINASFRSENEKVSITFQSQNIQTALQGTISGDQLKLQTPDTLSVTFTPEFARFFSEDTLLDSPARAVIVIDQLQLPINGPVGKTNIQLHLDPNKSDPDLVQYFGNSTLTIKTDRGDDPHFIVDSRVLQADVFLNLSRKQADGTITLKPEVKINLAADWGGHDLQLHFTGRELNGIVTLEGDRNMTADLQFKHFPLAQTCDLACTGPELRQQTRAIFGDNIDGQIRGKLSHWDGYVQADILGTNGKIHLNGRLTHGVLTLNDAMTAQLTVTPLLGSEVLEELFPILGGLMSSEDPVSLVIPPQGTQIQLLPFSTQNISIGDSTLKLGKMTISSKGELGDIISLLTKTRTDKIVVWFTPLYFNMQQGQINLYRTDMLVMDEYPIATWGKVNFPKDRVHMAIGFTPRAIEQAFHLKGLPEDYMLQVELKGTLNNASINRSKALAKISSLVASTQGTEGALVGTVINIASGSLSEPAPPAPTTDPLPWSTGGIAKGTGKKAKQKKLQSLILDKINPLK